MFFLRIPDVDDYSCEGKIEVEDRANKRHHKDISCVSDVSLENFTLKLIGMK